jgi:hypothetical protein
MPASPEPQPPKGISTNRTPERGNLIMNKLLTPVKEKSSITEKTQENGRIPGIETGLEIGHDQILSKYWELANLDPAATKGSITGQLKALDSLCEALVPAPIERHRDPMNRVPLPEIYRSAWMKS